MLDITKIALDDTATWDMICSGNVKGCFQIESRLGKTWCEKVKPRNIEELSDVIAILRPGCLKFVYDGKSMSQHYADRKAGIDEATPIHPCLTDLLGRTQHVLIYQEQIISIANKIAGFTETQSDSLRKCIAKGSYVMTSTGPVLIEELSSKHKILTLNNSRTVYRPIKKVWSNGIKKVLKLKTHNGMFIKLTDNHQVYTNRGWIDASEIITGDYVVCPKKYIYKGTSKCNKNTATILGYFISEGCYTDKSPPKITNSNPEILNIVRNAIKEEFGEGCIKESSYENGCVDLYLKGKAREFVETITDKCRAAGKKIPRTITNAEKGCTDAFIGAYFSGDGTIEISNKGVSISSSSIDIVLQLQELLIRDSIFGTIHKKWNEEYQNYSYVLAITVNKFVIMFLNTYRKYICAEKVIRIEHIIKDFDKATMSFDSFRIPDNIVKSCFGSQNLSRILGDMTTGTVYNGPLTVDKAIFINSLVNSKMIDEILNSDYYFVEVSDVLDENEECEVFDFEVDSDEHCGFINGILVHNSVGKKDAALMNKLESEFIDGCVNTKLVDREGAQLIFDNIKKSARYLFNLSHSVSYAYLSYWSAYLKANYPDKFYLNWLRQADDKIDPDRETKELISSAKNDGIRVYGPSIKHLNKNFETYDGNIYFGFCNVKNVGLAEFEKIRASLEGVELDWPSLMINHLVNLNKRAIDNLIYVGTFSIFGKSRLEMVHEISCLRELTDKELDWLRTNYDRNESIINNLKRLSPCKKDGGGTANKNRTTAILELINRLENPGRSLRDSPSVISKIEQELLGCELSSFEVDGCSDASYADSTCSEFLSGRVDRATLAVSIKEFREVKTKKKELMAFLTIEDSTGEMENIVVFPGPYADYSDIIYQNSTVLITGERDRNGGKSFMVEKIEQI